MSRTFKKDIEHDDKDEDILQYGSAETYRDANKV